MNNLRIEILKCKSMFFLFMNTVNTVNLSKPTDPWWIWLLKQLQAFINIWPFHQWVISLASLILLYWVTSYGYNKLLSRQGGWLTIKTRIWLILFDLGLNLVLGIYYMSHRETLMGAIMMRCPIAVSPLIFCLELLVVFFYYWYTNRKSDLGTPIEKTKK